LKLGEINLDTTRLKLREFELCDPRSLAGYISEAMQEANKILDTSVKNVQVNPEQIANMTPVEFISYVEELKSSLIKD